MDKKVRRLGRRTLELYKEMDPVAKRAAEVSGARCTKGCHSCCFMFVQISLPEGAAIAEHVLHKDETWAPRLPALMQKLFAEVQHYEADGFSEEEHFKTKRPCVFLNTKEGTCSIYEVRPAVCRYHYVVSDPALCSPDAGAQKVKILDLSGLEARVREEGDRSSRQVGAPHPTTAPIPVAVLWGMKILEEGAEGFEEKLKPLGRALQIHYWPSRMIRLAIERGMFDLKCSKCEYRKKLEPEDVRQRGAGCAECGEGTLEVVKAQETEDILRQERVGGEAG